MQRVPGGRLIGMNDGAPAYPAADKVERFAFGAVDAGKGQPVTLADYNDALPLA
jgi:hypothetical protein